MPAALGSPSTVLGNVVFGAPDATLTLAAGTAAGAARMTGALVHQRLLVGNARAGASCSPHLTVTPYKLLAASPKGSASVSATLSGALHLAGSASAGASATGLLKKIKLLAGNARGNATLVGLATHPYELLRGTAFAGATLRGALTGVAHAFTFVQVEIPAFYVDNVQILTLPTPAIVNLIPDIHAGMALGPAPAANTAIDFDLVDFAYDGIDFAHTSVTINGTPAITNGVTQTGFLVTVTNPATDTKRVHVQPSTPFTSGQIVTVVVTTQTLSPSTVVATRTWQFEVADTIAPALYGAVALGTKQVRVTWTEEVLASDPANLGDALNPAHYALVYVQTDPTAPGVSPIVTSVNRITSPGISPSVLDLLTDIDLTPGATYAITTSGVQDLAGNASTIGALQFVAFVPPRPATRSFDLWRMLPSINRLEDETGDLKRFVACLQEVTDLLLYQIDSWTQILDPDTAPEPFVDAMLADLGNPFPFVLDLTMKRKLVRTLVAIYKQKGTRAGILSTIRFFLGLELTMTTYTGSDMQLGVSQLGVDWVLGPGNSYALYAFRLVSPVTLTDAQRKQIKTIANYMRYAREHLVEIVEPQPPPPVVTPLQLGVSRLGVDWTLH